MAALIYAKVLKPKSGFPLSRWQISGLVFGIISALSSAGILVYGVWIFANLHGPVASYPMDAGYIYAIALGVREIIKKKRFVSNGKLFKFFSSMILGSSIVGLILHLLIYRFGVQELPQIIARAFT